jgi:hypothetical protein
MYDKEVEAEKFYSAILRQKREQFLFLLLGIILIVASLILVSIEKA